ncbi:LysR family transcriptional regulator [Halocynthiibacter styelae]|uniref:LysR family transcriptional regulator n=1 Tax=Halocynthiibacter styelae TaxID=2761955 RepID=A0A8J7IEX7_9RHOB|nr:LysR family transcriptional regulator [Paenihalocynthiibacter styelae]MBI1495419.1 LysR family transcriptional regulator [Paenihalocynthiibacter styelae]
MLNLNLRHLRCFIEVMVTGSMISAADNLGRTQPSISRAIKELENQLQKELFISVQGHLRPTSHSISLLPKAQSILKSFEVFWDDAKNDKSEETEKTKIAGMPAFTASFLPHLVSIYSDKYRETAFDISTLHWQNIVETMATGQYHYGFSEAAADTSFVNSTNFELPTLIALAKDDPLATEDVIIPRQLQMRKIVLQPRRHLHGQLIHEALRSSGEGIEIASEVTTYQSALPFVRAGKICACCDAMTVQGYLLNNAQQNNLIFKKFIPEIYLPSLFMRTKGASLSEPAEYFIEYVLSCIKAIISNPTEKLDCQRYLTTQV